MGKKKSDRKNNKLLKEQGLNEKYPFVSICTPTFNRRPFIPAMIKCFENQDYPKDKMEWIIIDDGTDKIEDLVCNIPQVKYFKYDTKMTLGKKRNLMHEKSCGDILVYMDDDDYYPPDRVSHAVNMLQTNPKALCAGSSIVYIYFKHINKMYQFGPYGPNHATAGTFAFKRVLLKQTRYEDEAALAEEKAFLKNYTIPFVQLDPFKSILVFSHEHNTFDKRKLLDNPHPKFVKESEKLVDEFIKEDDLKDFFMNKIEDLLKDYEPGRPSMKPDVLQQIAEIEEKRKKELENMTAQMKLENNSNICIKDMNGESKQLNHNEVVSILQIQQEQLKGLSIEIKMKDETIEQYKNQLSELNKKLESLRDLNLTLIKQVKSLKTSNLVLNVKESDNSFTEDISQNQIESKINIENESEHERTINNIIMEIEEANNKRQQREGNLDSEVHSILDQICI